MFLKGDDRMITIIIFNVLFVCIVIIGGALEREDAERSGGAADTVALIQLGLCIVHWLGLF